MTRCLLGNSKRTTIRVPVRMGSSVAMNTPPILMLAILRLTRDGPLLLLVNSYSTCAVASARSYLRRSAGLELFIGFINLFYLEVLRVKRLLLLLINILIAKGTDQPAN